jgi:hypothetical protein
MADLAARAVRPGRIPAKAFCRPEDHGLPSADGADDGDRHRGRRQADGHEIFKAPAGFLVVLARKHRYCPAASPSQFKLRAGQAAGRLSTTKMTLDPHRLVPPHVHADQDEYTYVAAGTIGVRVADGSSNRPRDAICSNLVLSLTRSGIPATSWREQLR